jgi:hypothetical protein
MAYRVAAEVPNAADWYADIRGDVCATREDDFHRRSGFYARAGKLVDSPFQSIHPLEVEVQTLDVARIIDLDEDHAIVRVRKGRN